MDVAEKGREYCEAEGEARGIAGEATFTLSALNVVVSGASSSSSAVEDEPACGGLSGLEITIE